VKEIPPSPTLPLKGGGRKLAPVFFVIAGLDPAIHPEPPQSRKLRMDARVKPITVIPEAERSEAVRNPQTGLQVWNPGSQAFARAPE
jgi:hypothetical protein